MTCSGRRSRSTQDNQVDDTVCIPAVPSASSRTRAPNVSANTANAAAGRLKTVRPRIRFVASTFIRSTDSLGSTANGRSSRRAGRSPYTANATNAAPVPKNSRFADDERLRHPRRRRNGRSDREQECQQCEDVRHPLGDDGAERLELRCPCPLPQHEHAYRLAGTTRQDAVEEVSDEHRVRDVTHRRLVGRREQEAPPDRAYEDRDGEHRDPRDEGPVVAPAERSLERAEVRAPEGEVDEDERNESSADHERGTRRRSPHPRSVPPSPSERDRPVPKVVITLPAYRAERTLERTIAEIPHGVADRLILVDDASPDNTAQIARELGIEVHVHRQNLGYGGNQKTCYIEALASGADVVVLLHPDYQYEPKAVPLLIAPILAGDADMTFGSRFAGLGDPVGGGMPLYRYFGNRLTTIAENLMLGSRFSELHSGLRAYTRRCLLSLPILRYSNDFLFDSQLLIDAMTTGQRVVEVPIPTRYTKESSSIAIDRSLRYIAGTLGYSARTAILRGRRGRRARSAGVAPPAAADADPRREPCPACAAATEPVAPLRSRSNAEHRGSPGVRCTSCGLVSSRVGRPRGDLSSHVGDGADPEAVLDVLGAYYAPGNRLLVLGHDEDGATVALARERGWTTRGRRPAASARQNVSAMAERAQGPCDRRRDRVPRRRCVVARRARRPRAREVVAPSRGAPRRRDPDLLVSEGWWRLRDEIPLDARLRACGADPCRLRDRRVGRVTSSPARRSVRTRGGERRGRRRPACAPHAVTSPIAGRRRGASRSRTGDAPRCARQAWRAPTQGPALAGCACQLGRFGVRECAVGAIDLAARRRGVGKRMVEGIERTIAGDAQLEPVASARVGDAYGDAVGLGIPDERDFDAVALAIRELLRLRLGRARSGDRRGDVAAVVARGGNRGG